MKIIYLVEQRFGGKAGVFGTLANFMIGYTIFEAIFDLIGYLFWGVSRVDLTLPVALLLAVAVRSRGLSLCLLAILYGFWCVGSNLLLLLAMFAKPMKPPLIIAYVAVFVGVALPWSMLNLCISFRAMRSIQKQIDVVPLTVEG